MRFIYRSAADIQVTSDKVDRGLHIQTTMKPSNVDRRMKVITLKTDVRGELKGMDIFSTAS